MPTPRATLVRLGRLLHERGLVAGLDGNLSLRLSPTEFLATASGAHLGLLTPADLLVVRARGRRGVTSEWPMHRAIYAARPDVHAIVHAHPVHAVARSLRGVGLDAAILPEVLVAVGPIATVPYATTGTEALATRVARALADRDAAILVRHGVVAVGPDPVTACARVEALEHAARILDAAGDGVPPLPAAERARLNDLRRRRTPAGPSSPLR